MINLVIMILIAVSASGAAIYAGYSFFESSQTVTDQQMTQARLEETASAITANLWQIDGSFYAPAGVNGADYMQVPAWITPNARSTANVPFLYCPFSPLQGSGTAATVELPGASNYTIQNYSSAFTQSHSYVVNSPSPPASAPAGTIAVLVAPARDASVPPSCTDLLLDSNGHLILNGAAAGSVVAITAGQFFQDRVNASANVLTLFVSPAGSGDFSGINFSNYTTLKNAMALWRAVKPRVMVLRLQAATTYAADATTFLPPTISGMNAGNARDQRLIMTGSGSVPAQTVINLTGDMPPLRAALHMQNLTLNMPGYDWAIEGTDKVSLYNFAATLRNFRLYDGTVDMKSSVAFNASGDSIIYPNGIVNALTDGWALTYSGSGNVLRIQGMVNTSSLNITAPNGAAPLSIEPGGNLISTDVTLSTSSGNLISGMEIYNGATVYVPGTTTVNQRPTLYAINNRGQLLLGFGSNALAVPSGAPIGVNLAEGGVLTMLGTIGQTTPTTARPDVGIYDAGGMSISGQVGIVYANPAAPAPLCWGGAQTPNIFSRSASNGASSAPNQTGNDFLKTDNASSWNCGL